MGQILPLADRQRRPVRFDFASGEKVQFRLVDEAASLSQHTYAEYMNLVQLFESEEGEKLVRISYYRRPRGGDDDSWEYGSQTALALKVQDWRELLREALRKPWFRSLVEGTPPNA